MLSYLKTFFFLGLAFKVILRGRTAFCLEVIISHCWCKSRLCILPLPHESWSLPAWLVGTAGHITFNPFRWSFPGLSGRFSTYMHWSTLSLILGEDPLQISEAMSQCISLFSNTLPCEFYLGLSLLSGLFPCLRLSAEYFQDSPSQCCVMETLNAVSWSNYRVHLICFLLFRDHCSLLLMYYVFKTIISYSCSFWGLF